MPSYHALLMAHAGIQPGDHVVHIGAGVGYYTAIMAHLAGATGRVTAIEFDPALAERAALNLSNTGNVQVHEGDGFAMPFEQADVIYVNAGATHPADNWLDGLNDGGRLILPLTAKKTLPLGDTGPITQHGAAFRIERNGADYLANWICGVGVYPCEGGAMRRRRSRLNTTTGRVAGKPSHELYSGCRLPFDRCWLRPIGGLWLMSNLSSLRRYQQASRA